MEAAVGWLVPHIFPHLGWLIHHRNGVICTATYTETQRQNEDTILCAFHPFFWCVRGEHEFVRNDDGKSVVVATVRILLFFVEAYLNTRRRSPTNSKRNVGEDNNVV